MSITRIGVRAEREYDVVLGRDLMGELPAMLEGASRVAVLYPEALESRASHVVELVSAAGLRPLTIALPDAEAAKTASVMEMCWNSLGEAGFTRNDVIVGLGGGATTDVAGFVAATWLRGIRVVHMPTTLLGMVDAAVGGKTGINTAAGKNLVGAFWSPSGVLCDVDALQSLPKADLIAGMAEIVKIGFVRDVSILDDIERDPIQAVDPSGALLVDLARRAIEVKAEVVSADFRESAAIGREVLNYGHTFGHAIEATAGYGTYLHGEAVAIGLVMAARLSAELKHCTAAQAEQVEATLKAHALPTALRAPLPLEPMLAAMRRDKKVRGGKLRFVLQDGVGAASTSDSVPEEAAIRALLAGGAVR